MHRREFVQTVAFGSILGGPLVLSGCGTLLHRERVHQPSSRDIDWGVAAMDGLGLALFFVPGVIAFAVDFYTGAIYLPPHHGQYDPGPSGYPSPTPAVSSTDAEGQSIVAQSGSRATELRRVPVERHELSKERIESIVSDQAGAAIDLTAIDVRVSRLEHLDRFSDQRSQHERDATFGTRALDMLARVWPA